MPKKDLSQTAMSVLYRLLNELIRYNEIADGHKGICGDSDNIKIRDFDENQKQQVRINVVTAIIDVAVYLKDDKVDTINIIR